MLGGRPACSRMASVDDKAKIEWQKRLERKDQEILEKDLVIKALRCGYNELFEQHQKFFLENQRLLEEGAELRVDCNDHLDDIAKLKGDCIYLTVENAELKEEIDGLQKCNEALHAQLQKHQQLDEKPKAV